MADKMKLTSTGIHFAISSDSSGKVITSAHIQKAIGVFPQNPVDLKWFRLTNSTTLEGSDQICDINTILNQVSSLLNLKLGNKLVTRCWSFMLRSLEQGDKYDLDFLHLEYYTLPFPAILAQWIRVNHNLVTGNDNLSLEESYKILGN